MGNKTDLAMLWTVFRSAYYETNNVWNTAFVNFFDNARNDMRLPVESMTKKSTELIEKGIRSSTVEVRWGCPLREQYFVAHLRAVHDVMGRQKRPKC